MNNNVYFTDIFEIEDSVIDDYGAMNISLINDLPLFIDPFLLFNSDKAEYVELHEGIIRYLSFLRDMADDTNEISNAKLKAWYTFSEVKQTWLGFSLTGNEGLGLGKEFAYELHKNLTKIFEGFGKEKITQSSHIEKLCIIGNKVGKDKISDFTINLIKKYLLEYTQKFAQKYLQPEKCKTFKIPRVEFNYQTFSWTSISYYLPHWQNDYIILTPKDLLTKDDTFINKTDMMYNYDNIAIAIDDDTLRFQMNTYLKGKLYSDVVKDKNDKIKEPTKKEKAEAFYSTIKMFPQIIDYYIKYKEINKKEATALSELAVNETEAFFIEQVRQLVNKLFSQTNFYNISVTSYDEALERVKYLKHIIEDCDGHKVFYYNDKPINKESNLHIMYKLVWFASPFNADSEVNNGRGPVDFKVSYGSSDTTLVEFKLASNSKLKNNIAKQVEVYEKANNTKNSIKVILYFSDEELNKVNNILAELKQNENPSIILIDGRRNKLSASNVKL